MLCYAEFPRGSFHHFGAIVVVHIGSGMARRNFKHQPEKRMFSRQEILEIHKQIALSNRPFLVTTN